MSLPTHDPVRLLELGERLRPLRDEGVLIIGSGFLTHGLPFLTEFRIDAAAPGWSTDFDAWAGEALARGDVDELASYRSQAPGMPYAHPTVEHYTPLFVTLGAATDPEAPGDQVIDGLLDGPVEAVAAGRLRRRFLMRAAQSVISSSSTRSASVGSQRSAAALARTWSPGGGAGDHRGDGRLGGEPGDGDVEQREVARGGVRLERLDPVPVGVASHCARPGRAARGSPPGRRSPRRYLPVSRPYSSGKNGSTPRPNALARRHDLVLDVAVEQRVAVLRRDEPLEAGGARGPVGVGDLPAGEVGAAEVARPCPRGPGRSAPRASPRSASRVGRVQLVEVDVVGAAAGAGCASTARRT